MYCFQDSDIVFNYKGADKLIVLMAIAGLSIQKLYFPSVLKIKQ